jgi:hypothetical protein
MLVVLSDRGGASCLPKLPIYHLLAHAFTRTVGLNWETRVHLKGSFESGSQVNGCRSTSLTHYSTCFVDGVVVFGFVMSWLSSFGSGASLDREMSRLAIGV